MSSRKKFLLVFGFIVLNMFMLVSFLVIRDATMENELKNEMEYLSKLDITKDRYNKKTVTRGKYAVVEKSIKKYLDDYHLELQEVLKLINDDENAFCELYSIYRNRLIYFAMRYLKSRDFAEDIFQDTFTIVWQSRKFINLDSSFSAYLYTIMRNRILNMLRDLEYQEQLKDYFVVSSCRCKR